MLYILGQWLLHLVSVTAVSCTWHLVSVTAVLGQYDCCLLYLVSVTAVLGQYDCCVLYLVSVTAVSCTLTVWLLCPVLGQCDCCVLYLVSVIAVSCTWSVWMLYLVSVTAVFCTWSVWLLWPYLLSVTVEMLYCLMFAGGPSSKKLKKSAIMEDLKLGVGGGDNWTTIFISLW